MITAKGLVVLLRGDVAPGDSAYDSAFGERKLALSIRLDRNIVSQNGANVVEVACIKRLYDAFVSVLKEAGVTDAERKVIVSDIPLRT